MNKHLQSIDFDKVLDKIIKYCQTDLGKIDIENINISTDYNKVNKLLNETNEAVELIYKIGELSLVSKKDLSNHFKKIDSQISLSINEFIDIKKQLKCTSDIINYRKNIDEINKDLDYLNNYFNNISFIKKLNDQLLSIFDEKNEVKDNASSKLLEIRVKIQKLEDNIKDNIDNIKKNNQNQLVEKITHTKNNRLCLPVKLEFKNTFKGIIHDESQSGNTVFIEPEINVKLTNKITTLKSEEKDEIIKILTELTIFSKDYIDELENNQRLITILDVIFAKAKYSKINECNIPSINNEGIIDINNLKHPLIDKDICVPIHVQLSDTYNCIVITGPNTGGKTLSLKSVGLNSYLVQCGILPHSDSSSKYTIFDKILVDIGDNQSIEANLSTFSSHMNNIISILEDSTKDSLILLDELGSGTDPKEGTSLAIAIIEELLKKESKVIATTHYSELKTFAYDNENILNASVDFNIDTLEPTYNLLLGVPGKSNAYIISKKLGLSEHIIENAKNLTSTNQSNVDKLVRKLEDSIITLNNKTKEQDKIKEQYLNKLNESSNAINDLELSKEKILNEAHEKAKAILDEANNQAKKIIIDLEELKSKGQVTKPELASIKHDVNKLKETKSEVKACDTELVIGDIVLIIPYGNEGTIKQFKSKKIEVQMGNMPMLFKRNELKFLRKPIKLKEKKTKFKSQMVNKVEKKYQTSLDLRGFRYEDAKIEITRFIDQALLSNLETIRFVHGFGTGTIRKLVHEMCKASPNVKSYRLGGEGEGLNGATIALLK